MQRIGFLVFDPKHTLFVLGPRFSRQFFWHSDSTHIPSLFTGSCCSSHHFLSSFNTFAIVPVEYKIPDFLIKMEKILISHFLEHKFFNKNIKFIYEKKKTDFQILVLGIITNREREIEVTNEHIYIYM